MNGNLKFNSEQFELFKLLLKNDILTKYEGEYFDPYVFSNIIGLSTTLGHITWCQKFIDKYHDKLNPVDRNNHYY